MAASGCSLRAGLADQPALRGSTGEGAHGLGALANEHERCSLAQSLGERVDVRDAVEGVRLPEKLRVDDVALMAFAGAVWQARFW
jgi:hypothetical protein